MILSGSFSVQCKQHLDYHSGLDLTKRRQRCLVGFRKLNSSKPNSFLNAYLLDAKSDEIFLFSGGPSSSISDLIDSLNKTLLEFEQMGMN
jgi:hypothetical protein